MRVIARLLLTVLVFMTVFPVLGLKVGGTFWPEGIGAVIIFATLAWLAAIVVELIANSIQFRTGIAGVFLVSGIALCLMAWFYPQLLVLNGWSTCMAIACLAWVIESTPES